MAKAKAEYAPAQVKSVTLELTLEEAQVLAAVIGATAPGDLNKTYNRGSGHPLDEMHRALTPIVGQRYPYNGERANPWATDGHMTVVVNKDAQT